MLQRKYKVVLLGEGRVGKTSILMRFCMNDYDNRQQPTLNASYLDKKLTLGTNPVILSIWDTAGQERYHALGPIYYRDADAAILVYDITDFESFQKVKKWIQELKTVVGDNILIAIAGNKVDLEKNRNVDAVEAVRYAESLHASHFLTSAKLNKGLEEIFLHLADRLLQTSNQELANAGKFSAVTSVGLVDSELHNNARKIVFVENQDGETTGDLIKEKSCC